MLKKSLEAPWLSKSEDDQVTQIMGQGGTGSKPRVTACSMLHRVSGCKADVRRPDPGEANVGIERPLRVPSQICSPRCRNDFHPRVPASLVKPRPVAVARWA